MSDTDKIQKRVKYIVDLFLTYENISINQISKITKISASTIQRDLQKFKYIEMIYGKDSKIILQKISDRLKRNKSHSCGMSIEEFNLLKKDQTLIYENSGLSEIKKR